MKKNFKSDFNECERSISDTLKTGFVLTLILLATEFANAQTSAAQVSNSLAVKSQSSCQLGCQEVPDVAPLFQYGTPILDQLPSRSLKLIAWNLYKGGMKEFSSIFPRVIADRDIVMLSEVITGREVMTGMLSMKGAQWSVAGSFMTKHDDWSGTAVGSKTKPENVRVIRTQDLEPLVKTPKTITAVEYKIPQSSKTLLALSIHGMNWSGDDAIVRQVQDIMPWIHAHQGPIVFAGDFNFKNTNRFDLIKNLLATEGITPIPWENPNAKKQLDNGYSRGVSFQRAYLLNDYIGKASDHPALMMELQITDY